MKLFLGQIITREKRFKDSQEGHEDARYESWMNGKIIIISEQKVPR